jgi:hypothetical protein
MLQPTSRFEFIPYEPTWYDALSHEEPWPNDDPRIIDYVSETHGEDIERIRPALLDELALSNAPYSNMHTACALETYTPKGASHEHNVRLGHREERLTEDGEFQVVTAIEMALAKIATNDEKVSDVYLTGCDLPAGKLKRMMPLPTDYDHLAERFDCDWGPTFLLIPPDSYGWPAMQGLGWVWASRHAKAYAQHDYLSVSWDYPEGYYSMRGTLLKHAKLTERDTKFVLDFTKAAINNSWTAFFTGSASGRGEITPALTDEYDDMDFIVVADRPEEAETSITTIAEQHYGKLLKVPEIAYDTYGGKKIKGFFLFDESGKKIIQLAAGKTMEEVCFRPDVIERNSGIWLNDCRHP